MIKIHISQFLYGTIARFNETAQAGAIGACKKIDVTESTLSRFISVRTDKLGDESVIRIVEIFNVSTDFLLGAVDAPDRKNYDISELGLSVDAALNL